MNDDDITLVLPADTVRSLLKKESSGFDLDEGWVSEWDDETPRTVNFRGWSAAPYAKADIKASRAITREFSSDRMAELLRKCKEKE